MMGEAGQSTITAVALGVSDESTLLQVETSAGRQTFRLQGSGATNPRGCPRGCKSTGPPVVPRKTVRRNDLVSEARARAGSKANSAP